MTTPLDAGIVPPPLRPEAYGATHPGRKRDHNEDHLAVLPRLGLFLVADGLGGHACGEEASLLAVDAARETFEDAALLARRGLPRPEPEALLRAALEHADGRVHAAAERAPAKRGMSTTLVAAHLHPDGLSIAHLGDSRVYRLRAGALEQLTEDHSFANESARLGYLVTGGMMTAVGHKLTRWIGSGEAMEPDTVEDELRAGDVLLLCTDGLSSVVREPEIAAILAGGGELAAMADRLIARANERGGPDNVTVALLRWPPLRRSEVDRRTGELTVEGYASLCVLLAAYPRWEPQILARYGVEDGASEELARRWQARFEDDPRALDAWEAAYERSVAGFTDAVYAVPPSSRGARAARVDQDGPPSFR